MIQINPRVISNGLIYYLDAAIPASYSGSGVTVRDLSIQQKLPTTLINGATGNTVNNVKVFGFDGVDDYAEANAVNVFPTISSNFTFECWFGFDRTTRGALIVFSQSPFGTVNRLHLEVYGQFNRILTRTTDNITSFYTEWDGFNTIDYPNYFNQVVMTCELGFVKIYVNGELVQSNVSTVTNNMTPSTLRFSRGGNAGSSYLKSDISIIKIYNKTLTASEILSNYDNLKTRFGL